jgi:peptide/nickel transport system ATP-binding protein
MGCAISWAQHATHEHWRRMTEPLLEVRGLRVRFNAQVEAVRGVSLSINSGETHCLVGESGCGKTVTALAVMGLLARGGIREAERLRFRGTDLLGLSETAMSKLRGDALGMIFQEPMTSLNPAYTVGSQMA